MLPRLLSDEPMGIDSPAIQGAAVQPVVQTVQDGLIDEEPIAPVTATVLASNADQAIIINPVTGLPITVATVERSRRSPARWTPASTTCAPRATGAQATTSTA